MNTLINLGKIDKPEVRSANPARVGNPLISGVKRASAASAGTRNRDF